MKNLTKLQIVVLLTGLTFLTGLLKGHFFMKLAAMPAETLAGAFGAMLVPFLQGYFIAKILFKKKQPISMMIGAISAIILAIFVAIRT